MHRNASPRRKESSSLRVIPIVSLFVLSLSTLAFADQQPREADPRIEGRVTDSSGAIIAGAQVEFQSATFHAVQVTGAQGSFVFENLPVLAGIIRVQARGFEPLQQDWRLGDRQQKLELVLRPATLAQQVTVTAARVPIRILDTPGTVLVLSSQDLSSAGTLALDDVLRQIPGFTLFRRTTSRTANPTSQGVSLRGLGASGASRALVISGDLPQNDPFGGWVYWDRIPRAAIDTVEVSAGGASPLYGSEALGGVINIIRRPVDRPALTLYSSYGAERTPDTSLFASESRGPWAGTVDAELFHTDGYIPVPLDQRGRVDSFASSEYATGDVAIQRKLGQHGQVFLRGSSFGENRNNGTLLQDNRTTIRELELGGDWRSDSLGRFSASGYVGRDIYNQTFSSISSDRNTENLTRIQRVPAQEIGVNAQWSRAAGRHQTVVAGAEAHEFRGESDELGISSNIAVRAINAGGRQHNVGVYGEDIIQLTSRWLLTPVVRVDHWTNFDAFSSTQSLVPARPAVSTPFTDRDETFVSPRLGTLYRLTSHLSLTGSGYRSFRAPTLNELYRSFQQGNTLTRANAQLLAERLTGAEGGVIVTSLSQRLLVRGDYFWAEINRPVENVTIPLTSPGCAVPGVTICRQRQNLGQTRSRGLEIEAEAHVSSNLTFSGGFEFANATVVSFPGAPLQNLAGLEIPQVPRHAFSVQARYFKPHWVLLGVQGRFVGVQFDDDLNRFLLRRYFTMDMMASHPLTGALDAFVAAENLLNQRYDIGRTPVLTVAPPIMARVGLRLNLGGR